jgi:cholesterol oxidase
MVNADHQAVKRDMADPRYDALPDNYFEAGLSIETPILFVTGDKNRVFSDSNIHCYQEMKARGVEHHQLHVFENYGHQDIFMGKNVASDVFPVMLDFINSKRQG